MRLAAADDRHPSQNELFAYSPAGDLTSYTDIRGLERQFFYDAAHRLTRIDYTLPVVESIEFAYDEANNLTSLTERSGDQLLMKLPFWTSGPRSLAAVPTRGVVGGLGETQPGKREKPSWETLDKTKHNRYCSLMAANSRFAVGVHCLLGLAYLGEAGATAEMLAGSVQTNPVVLRRLLKSLERQGLVEIRQGKGGGVRLSRSPSSITLADIYAAVETDAEIFAYHEAEPNPACIVSCKVKQVLEPIFAAASEAVRSTLAQTHLSDLLDAVQCPKP